MTRDIWIEVQPDKIVVNPSPANADRGDVIRWRTKFAKGITIVPVQDGLTMIDDTASPNEPAVALATNVGYYQYDVYAPCADQLGGLDEEPQRIVAVLIVSEYVQGQSPRHDIQEQAQPAKA